MVFGCISAALGPCDVVLVPCGIVSELRTAGKVFCFTLEITAVVVGCRQNDPLILLISGPVSKVKLLLCESAGVCRFSWSGLVGSPWVCLWETLLSSAHLGFCWYLGCRKECTVCLYLCPDSGSASLERCGQTEDLNLIVKFNVSQQLSSLTIHRLCRLHIQ